MRFTILTLFPKAFDSYLGESILKRAREKKLIKIDIVAIRKFTSDKHHTADGQPYGGGAGEGGRADIARGRLITEIGSQGTPEEKGFYSFSSWQTIQQ